MIEVIGDLWHYPTDWRLITTNGFIKNNGEAVMGRGCAREAAIKYPDLPKIFGERLRVNGNIIIMFEEYHLMTFPVKHKWWQIADLNLIRESAKQLKSFADGWDHDRFLLPRPGCGNGNLSWEEVKPLLIDLPDNVMVITNVKQ